MHAKFTAGNGRQLSLDIPLPDFLYSGVMVRQAKAAMCEPEDLLRDYVREDLAVYGDDEEVAQEFGEAVMLATDHAVTNVEIDREDLAYVRQHFGNGPVLAA